MRLTKSLHIETTLTSTTQASETDEVEHFNNQIESCETTPHNDSGEPEMANKKRRRIRISRLDYSNRNSSINKSEFWGFLNLFNICAGIFVITDPIVRRYETGRFFDPTLAQIMFDDLFFLLFLWLKCYLWSSTAFFAHKGYISGKISRKSLRIIQFITETLLLVYNTGQCLYNDWSIFPTGFVLLVSIISFMKMHSFTESLLDLHDLKACLVAKYKIGIHQEDRSRMLYLGRSKPTLTTLHEMLIKDLRFRKFQPSSVKKLTEDNSEDRLETMDLTSWEHILDTDLNTNPTYKYFLYYLVCPVLVYEPHYPKGQPFRPLYFCRKLLEMLTAMVVFYFICVRHLIPIFRWSINVSFARAMLQLIWPMLICYILVFFILFECMCNLFAEITCFGDREFYNDWWNSTTFSEFSRKWNRPVHEFLLRHVYYQSLNKLKLSKTAASATTFFLSALFHEFVMATCFKVIRFWMFGLMMLQIPLIQLGHHHEGTNFGNCVFWVGMLFGIPVLSVAYGREYAHQATTVDDIHVNI